MVLHKDQLKTEVRVGMRGGPGQAVMTNLCDELPKNCRVASVIHLEPGHGIGYHEHHGETELYYILTGSGVVNDNGAPRPGLRRGLHHHRRRRARHHQHRRNAAGHGGRGHHRVKTKSAGHTGAFLLPTCAAAGLDAMDPLHLGFQQGQHSLQGVALHPQVRQDADGLPADVPGSEVQSVAQADAQMGVGQEILPPAVVAQRSRRVAADQQGVHAPRVEGEAAQRLPAETVFLSTSKMRV